ncbi:methylated-DNA--[protein]-cysteine S-methyltransferase [Wolbachia endosymbiont (group E) of Neria commutata]|uniref:methylated-DNA--[protein]-cysteine S-methyltransferase n=1 Tax=Wolbachia endosymbiont (group E) of Neria commutata TaxID=3066149 RepID=UPI00313348BA
MLKITTPKEDKNNLEIFYGFHSTLFGNALIGVTEKGICCLSFVDDSETSAIAALQKEWPQAQLKEDTYYTKTVVRSIFENDENPKKSFCLFAKGTDFQVKVWQGLLSIPKGTTTTYENIACMIGKPKAVRATANAIANNPISYLIPCHRVIRKSGEIHKYRWGIERKKAILAYEATHLTLA